MESNHALFLRTFFVVVVFAFIVLGLLFLEKLVIYHAGTSMYGTPTPPYITVMGQYEHMFPNPSSVFLHVFHQLSSFLLYGN